MKLCLFFLYCKDTLCKGSCQTDNVYLLIKPVYNLCLLQPKVDDEGQRRGITATRGSTRAVRARRLHFRLYIPNQPVLFPGRIDENIASNDPVRIVNAVVDNLNLDSFRKLYKETGRCPYPPKMMLKMIIYAYMNNIYSCRKIEKLLLRDIHYMWLSVMSIRILLPSTVFVTV